MLKKLIENNCELIVATINDKKVVKLLVGEEGTIMTALDNEDGIAGLMNEISEFMNSPKAQKVVSTVKFVKEEAKAEPEVKAKVEPKTDGKTKKAVSKETPTDGLFKQEPAKEPVKEVVAESKPAAETVLAKDEVVDAAIAMGDSNGADDDDNW